MRRLSIFLLALAAAISSAGQVAPAAAPAKEPGATSTTPNQGTATAAPDTSRTSPPAAASTNAPDLANGKLGIDDVVGVTVYDAPELSRSARIDAQGNIRLPMVQQRIHADGLTTSLLESAITAALVDEHVMVNPVVSVSVVEYHSHPITIIGAVRNPTTFQAVGPVTLFDAITRAGGLADNAGSEILISRHSELDPSVVLTDRVKVQTMLDGSDPASNPTLQGGENIRVPDGGRIFVVGNVKRPGPFQITAESHSSIMEALSIAGGLDSYSSHTAYIYRVENGKKDEIPVDVHNILARKSPDVPLFANDMLYVPTATGKKVSARTLGIAFSVGIAMAGLLIWATQ